MKFRLLFASISLALIASLSACNHPLVIIGEGDIVSETGTRDCTLENFEAGAENCTKNFVASDYVETYTATPREGSNFDRWSNQCTIRLSDECDFNIPADAVGKFWGETAPPLIAKFREETSGFNVLFAGHSFFRPFAEGMPAHASANGFDAHEQSIIFSGKATGAPEALWDNETKRAAIQAILDTGEVELFGLTYHPTYPSPRGYKLWIDYALEQNSNTKFFIALPWLPSPKNYESEAYHTNWKALHVNGMHPFIDQLREEYPNIELYCIPYGQAAGELYTRYSRDALSDIDALVGDDNHSGVFSDDFGHADDILEELGRLVWFYSIYGVRPKASDYDAGFEADLSAIADAIVIEHDPYYDAR